MLALTKRDDSGKLIAGNMFCTSALAQQKWIKRLRSLGFNYIMDYHDTQSRWSLMFFRDNPTPKQPVVYPDYEIKMETILDKYNQLKEGTQSYAEGPQPEDAEVTYKWLWQTASSMVRGGEADRRSAADDGPYGRII